MDFLLVVVYAIVGLFAHFRRRSSVASAVQVQANVKNQAAACGCEVKKSFGWSGSDPAAGRHYRVGCSSPENNGRRPGALAA
jgi:hypothetical protein